MLGRIFVGHDEASRNYGVRPLMSSRVKRRPTFWKVPVGFPLDQGAEGACTGFATATELAAGPVHVENLTNEWAQKFYNRVQITDRSMGNNFPGGGATVLATMKTAKAEGLISGYRWAFGIDDVIDSLMSGPVCLGIEWRDSMYQTSSTGIVSSRGSVVGGHFITAVAMDLHPKLGPVVGWVNTWGNDYGVGDGRLGLTGGVGWITASDLSDILAINGEAVVPADYFRPAFFGTKTSFHDVHKGIKGTREFATREEALKADLRPCRVCKP